MKKKLLAIALITVMELSLAACGSGGANDKKSDKSSVETTTAAEESKASEDSDKSKESDKKASTGGTADNLSEVKPKKAYKFGLTALETGELTFTVFQNAEGQGR